ncbi:hypothetical protein ACJIZ3_002417 [Penstemon smallii]|uniref:Protein yippee-like n=1 Tax=Penstemon smallii TaxID=265156 RepID=A0ABD3U6D4_9LAMI
MSIPNPNPIPNPFENMRVLVCRRCFFPIFLYELRPGVLRFTMGTFNVYINHRSIKVDHHPYVMLKYANVRMGEMVQDRCREVFCLRCNTNLGWYLALERSYIIDITATLVVYWQGNKLRCRKIGIPTHPTPPPEQRQG